MTGEEFDRQVAKMIAIWPGREMDEGQVLMWGQTMGHLSADVAGAAIDALRCTEEFPPSHAKFLGAVRDVLTQRDRERALARGLGADSSPPCPSDVALSALAEVKARIAAVPPEKFSPVAASVAGVVDRLAAKMRLPAENPSPPDNG